MMMKRVIVVGVVVVVVMLVMMGMIVVMVMMVMIQTPGCKGFYWFKNLLARVCIS